MRLIGARQHHPFFNSLFNIEYESLARVRLRLTVNSPLKNNNVIPAQAGIRSISREREQLMILKILAIVWALPYTLLGLLVGAIGLASGGNVRLREGTLQFWGGFARWFVRHLPLGECTIAFTLGHTILGQTEAGLDLAHRHELVHVRQYERWGLLMGFVYLGASLVLWLSGKDPYRDNPFEREAYACDDRRPS